MILALVAAKFQPRRGGMIWICAASYKTTLLLKYHAIPKGWHDYMTKLFVYPTLESKEERLAKVSAGASHQTGRLIFFSRRISGLALPH